MASSNGNDITLKVGMDVTDAKNAITTFSAYADKGFKSTNTRMQGMANSLTRVVQNLQKCVTQMEKMKTTYVPTKDYSEAVKTMDSLEKKIKSTESEMRKLWKNKPETAEYTQAKIIFDDINTKVKQLQTNLKQTYGKNALTTEFRAVDSEVARLEKRLSSLQAQKSILESTGVKSGNEWTTLDNQVNQYATALNNAKKARLQLIMAGKMYQDQSGYNKLISEIRTLEQQLIVADQKVKQLQTDGKQFDTTAYDEAKTKLALLQQAYEEARLKKEALERTGSDRDTIANVNPESLKTVQTRMSDIVRQGNLITNNMDNISIKTVNWRSAISKISSLWSNLNNKIKSVVTGHNNASNSLSGFSKNHTNSFKSMITMVLKYVFGIRSIFLLYKKIRTTISTGLTEMSKQFSDVADDVYELKNSWSGFKASLVSAFQPIFSYVVPALTTLINYLTSAMNALANFFALLTGQSYYYKAKKGNESVAKSIGSTGSAAEEANEELAEYDDLIVIDQDSDSGSGSGGSGSSSSDAWNWEKTATQASEWAELIKDAFTDWDFTDVGSKVAEKLTSALKSIDWNDVYKSASNFGKGLATFLNGLFTSDSGKDLFEELGKTVANSINTALKFLNSFATWFEWTDFGANVASGINSLIANADFKLAVDTANKWINGILDALTTAVSNVDWKSLANKITEAIGGVDTSGFGEKLGNLVNAISGALYNLASNKDTWKDLGTKIADGINAFVSTTDFSLATSTFSAWAEGILSTLISAVQGVEWKNLATKISEGIAGIDASGIGWELGTLVDSLIDAIYNLVSNKSTWTNLGTKIGEGINGFFEGFEGSSLAETVNAIKDALFDTISTAVEKIEWTKIGEDIVSFLGDLDIGTIALAIGGVMLATGTASQLLTWATSAIMAKLSALTMATMGISLGTLAVNVAGVVIAAGAAFKIGWEFGTTAGEWLAAHLKDAGIISDEANEDYYTIAESMTMMEKINDIKLSVKEGTFATAWTNMWGDWFDPTFAEIESIGVKIKSIALELVDGWNNTNDKIWDPVFELGEDIWEGIKDAFTKVIDWASPIKDMFDNIVQKIKDKFGIHSPAESMKTYGEQIFNGIIDGFKSMFSGDSIKNMMSTLYTNIVNKIKDKFKDFKLSNIITGLGDVAVNVTTTFKNGITKLADFTGLDDTLSNIKNNYKDMKSKLTTTMEGVATKLDDIPTLKDKFKELTDTWTDKASKLKAEVGGQLSKVTDIDSWKTKFSNLTTAWQDDSATMKAQVGSQIKNIDELSTNSNSWKTKFTNLFTAWKDKSATYSTKTGGQISNINELSTNSGTSWKDKFLGLFNSWTSPKQAEFNAKADTQNVEDSLKDTGGYGKSKKSWKDHQAKFDVKPDTGAVTTSIAKGGSMYNAKDTWSQQTATATFKTAPNTAGVDDARTSNSGALQVAKRNWEAFSATSIFKTAPDTSEVDYSRTHDDSRSSNNLAHSGKQWSAFKATATFSSKADLQPISDQWYKGNSDLNYWYNQWTSMVASATFTASFSYSESEMNTFCKNLKNKMQEQLRLTMRVNTDGGTVRVEATNQATGGAFYNNMWHDIPQYARGGKPNHGSFFLAGEAGPEIVGHLNGRTEVLNKSQIASTLHSAFVTAMNQFGNILVSALDRNFALMYSLTNAVTDKLMSMNIPDIVTGSILPMTEAFTNTTLKTDTSALEQKLDMIISALTDNSDSNIPPVMLQLEGRQIAQVVWNESEKRYKQTGVRPAY